MCVLGIGLKQIRAGFHIHRSRFGSKGKSDLHVNGHWRPHVHILRGGLKTRSRDTEMIVVIGNVVEFKTSLSVCLGGSIELRHRILNLYLRASNGGSRWVEHGASHDSVGLRVTKDTGEGKERYQGELLHYLDYSGEICQGLEVSGKWAG